ncbi:hypothetical protein F5146DRAFT_1120748, partial [Armillaria mellea]
MGTHLFLSGSTSKSCTCPSLLLRGSRIHPTGHRASDVWSLVLVRLIEAFDGDAVLAVLRQDVEKARIAVVGCAYLALTRRTEARIASLVLGINSCPGMNMVLEERSKRSVQESAKGTRKGIPLRATLIKAKLSQLGHTSNPRHSHNGFEGGARNPGAPTRFRKRVTSRAKECWCFEVLRLVPGFKFQRSASTYTSTIFAITRLEFWFKKTQCISRGQSQAGEGVDREGLLPLGANRPQWFYVIREGMFWEENEEWNNREPATIRTGFCVARVAPMSRSRKFGISPTNPLQHSREKECSCTSSILMRKGSHGQVRTRNEDPGDFRCRIEDIAITQESIRSLHNAPIYNGDTSEDDIETLLHPPGSPLELDKEEDKASLLARLPGGTKPQVRLSEEAFLATVFFLGRCPLNTTKQLSHA